MSTIKREIKNVAESRVVVAAKPSMLPGAEFLPRETVMILATFSLMFHERPQSHVKFGPCRISPPLAEGIGVHPKRGPPEIG